MGGLVDAQNLLEGDLLDLSGLGMWWNLDGMGREEKKRLDTKGDNGQVVELSFAGFCHTAVA